MHTSSQGIACFMSRGFWRGKCGVKRLSERERGSEWGSDFTRIIVARSGIFVQTSCGMNQDAAVDGFNTI
jgi:hypothetical protein